MAFFYDELSGESWGGAVGHPRYRMEQTSVDAGASGGGGNFGAGSRAVYTHDAQTNSAVGFDMRGFADYVSAGDSEPVAFDDLFDAAAYRTTQSSFQRRGGSLQPRGQTFYRNTTAYENQGIPESSSSAHWGWLANRAPQQSSSQSQDAKRRARVHALKSIAVGAPRR